MSIGSINPPRIPATEGQQSTGSAETGNYSNKTVNQSIGQDVNASSILNSAIPRNRLRLRNARIPTRSENRGLFSQLQLCFRKPRSRSQISSPAASAAKVPDSLAMAKGQATILIDIAKGGIAVAKGQIVDGLDSKKSSSDVKSFLESGDKGIRRGTTGIYNIGEIVSFENLSAQEKKHFPTHSLEDLRQQSMQIKRMAQTITKAKFLDGTRDFLQCGTTEKNSYTEMMAMHPEQDMAMRTWIRDGVNLGGELADAQERIIVEGEMLSQGDLDDLQNRVDGFSTNADIVPSDPKQTMEDDLPPPIDINVAQGFTEEVLSEVDEKIKP